MPAITRQFTDFPNRMVSELQTFDGCARLIVTLCTISVLTAVLMNFMLAKTSRAVRTKRKSSVATGAMLAFFAGVYLLIRFRIGARVIPQIYHPAAILGLMLVVLGTVVNITGRFSLGRNWGNQVIIYEDHRLVTGGVYRLVRHPLYAGLIWMFTGAALVFQNWAALAATILIFFPGVYYRGKQEEKALVAQFPDYADYRNRTGMFFPMAMGPEVARVPRAAFAFCRISLTMLLWLALWYDSVWLVTAVFAILLLSAIVKVQHSPVIQLYQQTVLRIFPTWHFELLDVPAMRFAHTMGMMMSLAVILAMLADSQIGWFGLLAFCLLKTVAALGYCPASKLFACMKNGGCCALTRMN
jgi:protein-S-isoprenylcysteine O-methyltransferase Ste14